MMKLFLSIIIISITLIMMFLNNPLSMGLMILIQTILICLLTGMFMKSYWFSYILFLIFLGGLLVLFIYVTSIAANELFYSSFNMKINLLIMLTLMMMMSFYFKNKLTWMNIMMNSDMINLWMMKKLFIFNYSNIIYLNKLYNNQTFYIMLMLMIYLFIVLISVVKIINIFYGPLRSNY
uniref:NADH-ubiquinone oxidoreductase chain 6 n=1 Tax=Dasychira tristis TaxID=1706456 RepID=A0A8K1YX10_9NEOP|nr:NADH dehydrogenase subunit 6 [Dasychira tristis]